MSPENCQSTVRTLARLAGIPCPALLADSFTYVVWNSGDRWGHINISGRVTEYSAAAGRHVTIYQYAH